MEKSSDHINPIPSSYLNAAGFDTSTYLTPMLDILNGIIQALEMMVAPNYPTFENNEDIITARLIEDFLEKDEIQVELSLKTYRFIAEPASYNLQYLQIGYSDIRVIVTNRIGVFDTTKADYIIECKRLDGKKELNKKYVENGICRFVEEKYTWKNVHKVSAMIGYVVSATDIPLCVQAINNIGRKSKLACFDQELTFYQIRPGFEYSYHSVHNTVNGNEAEVYHVLFNLNDKIIK